MRRIFAFINVTLDGYFEGPGHDLSWSHGDFEGFSEERGREVDILLLGKRTYDMMAAFWPTPAAAQMAPDVAAIMNDRRKVVASHAPFDPGWRNVTVFSGATEDVVDQVRQLKAQEGGTILILGSSTLCASLVDAGLIDEFQLLVNPVLLGEGTTLFEGLHNRTTLRLRDAHPYPSGKVLLTYEA